MSGIEICAGDVQAGMLVSVVKDAGFAEIVANCEVTCHAFHFDFWLKTQSEKNLKENNSTAQAKK